MSDQNDNTQEPKNLFDDLGLSLEFGDVEVGQVYPIFGVITKFISTEPGNIIVTINDNIEALMNVEDPEKIETLKNRCFDSGIFVCYVKEVGTPIKVECSTVIFGKNNNTVQ